MAFGSRFQEFIAPESFRKGFQGAESFREKNSRFPKYGILFAVPRVESRGSFLNVSWPRHGSKSFRIGCPGSFSERRAESRKLFASKTVPAVPGSPFSVGASAHPVFKIAVLFTAAAMGAVARVQTWFPHVV